MVSLVHHTDTHTHTAHALHWDFDWLSGQGVTDCLVSVECFVSCVLLLFVLLFFLIVVGPVFHPFLCFLFCLYCPWLSMKNKFFRKSELKKFEKYEYK